MEKNNKLRYLKLPDYSLLRITALRSNPKLEDWKPDQGDRSKMQFDLIPGQTTIVTCSTDGSITDNLPHITPEHKYLLYTLWTKHFEDGEDQDINRISYAEICQRLKRKPSGTEYKRIDKRLLDLKMMTIKINNGKKDYVFGLLDGYTADKVRDSGNRSIEYTLGRIIINGRKRLPFTCHTYLIDRLTIGQRNIIEYLMSHRSEKVSQFGNLEYHTCFEEVKSFSLRRGYLQDDARGNRNIKRFYRDLKDLVERYPRHQDNKEYPGFAYQVKESKGKEIIYLYLCNTRGPQ